MSKTIETAGIEMMVEVFDNEDGSYGVMVEPTLMCFRQFRSEEVFVGKREDAEKHAEKMAEIVTDWISDEVIRQRP